MVLEYLAILHHKPAFSGPLIFAGRTTDLARNAKNESSRIDSSATAAAEHQRCSGSFEHTAGDRKSHPAQS